MLPKRIPSGLISKDSVKFKAKVKSSKNILSSEKFQWNKFYFHVKSNKHNSVQFFNYHSAHIFDQMLKNKLKIKWKSDC